MSVLWTSGRPAAPPASGRSGASNSRGGVRDLTDNRTSGMAEGSGGISGGGNGQPFTLAPIADGDVLANISGATAAPVGDGLSAVLDHVFGSTQGDILYRDASAWKVLAPGTAGNVLSTQGFGANPQWAAVPAKPSNFFIAGGNKYVAIVGNGLADPYPVLDSSGLPVYSLNPF